MTIHPEVATDRNGGKSNMDLSDANGASIPAAVFVTDSAGPSWLVFADPQTGTRINPVQAPIWSERMHMLETSVADDTAVGFEDLEARITAEVAEAQDRFDSIDLPALDLPALPYSTVHSLRPRARLLERLRGRAA